MQRNWKLLNILNFQKHFKIFKNHTKWVKSSLFAPMRKIHAKGKPVVVIWSLGRSWQWLSPLGSENFTRTMDSIGQNNAMWTSTEQRILVLRNRKPVVISDLSINWSTKIDKSAVLMVMWLILASVNWIALYESYTSIIFSLHWCKYLVFYLWFSFRLVLYFYNLVFI